MSWDIKFVATSRDSAISAWDKAMAKTPDYVTQHGKAIFRSIRESIAAFDANAARAVSVHSYGHFGIHSETKEFLLFGLFVEIKEIVISE